MDMFHVSEEHMISGIFINPMVLCSPGGRVDMFHVSEEHMISGIFIKHVLEDSPAGRNGTLKTGDRILKVRF